MKAMIYNGSSKTAIEARPKPVIKAPTDALAQITKTTICGTDLHIIKGDVPTCEPRWILGHEEVGVIDEVGGAVTWFKEGGHVLISCVSACGDCNYRQMYPHCTRGGWILGHKIEGALAEFVCTPHADLSLYHIRNGADEEALVILSDTRPIGIECGVLNGKVATVYVVANVGAGPIGRASRMTA